MNYQKGIEDNFNRELSKYRLINKDCANFNLKLYIYCRPPRRDSRLLFLYIYICCKLREMNDHIDGHYELHLLIFKMSNGSS